MKIDLFGKGILGRRAYIRNMLTLITIMLVINITAGIAYQFSKGSLNLPLALAAVILALINCTVLTFFLLRTMNRRLKDIYYPESVGFFFQILSFILFYIPIAGQYFAILLSLKKGNFTEKNEEKKGWAIKIHFLIGGTIAVLFLIFFIIRLVSYIHLIPNILSKEAPGAFPKINYSIEPSFTYTIFDAFSPSLRYLEHSVLSANAVLKMKTNVFRDIDQQ